jgi:WD40 repeat protein
LWRLDSGKVEETIETRSGVVRWLAFSAGGRFLATSGGDRVVRVWDLSRVSRNR